MVIFEWKNKPLSMGCRKIIWVRVTHFARKLKWQFRDEEGKWDYKRQPSFQDWQKLHYQAIARYQRGKLNYKIVQLIERCLSNARSQQEAKPSVETNTPNADFN